MDKLLPCPFCGRSKNVQLETDFRPDRTKCNWSARVICLDCFGTVQTHGFEWTREAAKNEAIAAWNRRADARQLALKTRVCPMCEDCPDGCPVETPKDSRNIVTNADRIRSMTDEELVEFICGIDGVGDPDYCAIVEVCPEEGVKRRYAAQKAQLKAEREAASRKPNQEILEIAAKAKKKKMSYGEYVHKYEPRKEPKKEVKPVESICDTCPVKKCNNGAKNCKRWARDFARKWREIQRRAGVHVDGQADQSMA